MKNKIMFILLLVILCLPFISAKEYMVTNLPSCYDQAFVKVRGETNLSNEISVKGCTLKDELWVCPCNDNLTINLDVIDNIDKEYDIKIEYYLNSNKEDSQRILNFNNIKINTKEEKEKVRFKMPETTIGTWMIILGLIVLIVIVGVLLLIRWLAKDDIDEKSKTITEKRELKEENNIKDIDDILNDLET